VKAALEKCGVNAVCGGGGGGGGGRAPSKVPPERNGN